MLIKAETKPGELVLDVTNDASGFDPGDAERIFRPFQRGRNTSVNSAGAGLGLALAKEIAQRTGAGLDLTWSEDESVINFRLEFPAKASS